MRRAEEATERQKIQGSGPSFLEMQARPGALALPPPTCRARGGQHAEGTLVFARLVSGHLCARSPAAGRPARLRAGLSQRSLPSQVQDRAFAQEAADAERATPQRSSSKKLSCECRGRSHCSMALTLASAGSRELAGRGSVAPYTA